MLRLSRWFAVSAIAVTLLASGSAVSKAEGEAKSLYDRLGGLPAISMVVDDLIDALVIDETLNQNPAIDEARKRVPAPYLKYHVTAMVCQVTGGPCTYGGRDMQAAHAHLNITEAEWDHFVKVFVGILDKYGVPEAEKNEVLTIVGSTKADIVSAGGGS